MLLVGGIIVWRYSLSKAIPSDNVSGYLNRTHDNTLYLNPVYGFNPSGQQPNSVPVNGTEYSVPMSEDNDAEYLKIGENQPQNYLVPSSPTTLYVAPEYSEVDDVDHRYLVPSSTSQNVINTYDAPLAGNLYAVPFEGTETYTIYNQDLATYEMPIANYSRFNDPQVQEAQREYSRFNDPSGIPRSNSSSQT